ncbi:MAG: type II toxin-antitoxin system RelE/ParE family toxin [Candidatus Eisenbacteria bacterium]|nr:type II toxin-antitoxin system RelE/ParE family toxin [Candidatus Eisenbacteria bacterium]
MTFELIVLDAAEEELAEAEARYELQRPGLGAVFLSAVSAAIDRLLAFPLSGGAVPGILEDLGARAVHVSKFPYSVIVVQEGSVLWIVAFAHQRRRPGYWRDRLEGHS